MSWKQSPQPGTIWNERISKLHSIVFNLKWMYYLVWSSFTGHVKINRSLKYTKTLLTAHGYDQLYVQPTAEIFNKTKYVEILNDTIVVAILTNSSHNPPVEQLHGTCKSIRTIFSHDSSCTDWRNRTKKSRAHVPAEIWPTICVSDVRAPCTGTLYFVGLSATRQWKMISVHRWTSDIAARSESNSKAYSEQQKTSINIDSNTKIRRFLFACPYCRLCCVYSMLEFEIAGKWQMCDYKGLRFLRLSKIDGLCQIMGKFTTHSDATTLVDKL